VYDDVTLVVMMVHLYVMMLLCDDAYYVGLLVVCHILCYFLQFVAVKLTENYLKKNTCADSTAIGTGLRGKLPERAFARADLK
jgi:hypothetical protein